MIVGGSDVIFPIPPDVDVTELILRRVRRYWPDARFQDIDSDIDRAISDPWVVIHGGLSVEFLIYRDRHAVEAWDIEGATAENLDLMLYFIVRNDLGGVDRPREVTLVCGERTAHLRALIRDLASIFENNQIPRSRPSAA